MARDIKAHQPASHDSAATSILGNGARVRGRVLGDGGLRVLGQIEGDIELNGDLALEESGSIQGDVAADAVILAGTLVGDVAARGSVVVRASGNVSGNLAGSEISLEEGAMFSGRIDAEFDLPPELSERAKSRS